MLLLPGSGIGLESLFSHSGSVLMVTTLIPVSEDILDTLMIYGSVSLLIISPLSPNRYTGISYGSLLGLIYTSFFVLIPLSVPEVVMV